MKQLLSLLFFPIAFSFAQAPDYAQRLRDADAFIKTDPSATSYYQRGYLEFSNNDFQKALADYDKAIALDPNNYEFYFSRGNLKEKLGDHQAAISDYTEAIARNDDSAKLFYSRAYSKSLAADLEGAITDYSECLKLNPKYKGAWLNRGIVFKNQTQLAKAIADYDKAILIDPDFSEAIQNRAIAKSLAADPTALEDFNRVVALNPNDGECYYNRGVYLLNTRQGGDYCPDLLRAMQLNFDAAHSVYSKNCIAARKKAGKHASRKKGKARKKKR